MTMSLIQTISQKSWDQKVLLAKLGHEPEVHEPEIEPGGLASGRSRSGSSA
jgi:hypothetical protein